jgi:hypothetical protein
MASALFLLVWRIFENDAKNWSKTMQARAAGLQSVDIPDDMDYAIVSRFTGDQQFFMKELVEKGHSTRADQKSKSQPPLHPAFSQAALING